MPTNRMPRCRGLFGFIVGHKFFYDGAVHRYPQPNCVRCGLPLPEVE